MDIQQISWGKLNHFHCTIAGFTALIFDGYGLRNHLLARPVNSALYPIPVRRLAALLQTSFMHCLATLHLSFATLHHRQVV
ncbi:hypothetical protein BH10CYA1_BH10CYA1_29290 [soil metagenome]